VTRRREAYEKLMKTGETMIDALEAYFLAESYGKGGNVAWPVDLAAGDTGIEFTEELARAVASALSDRGKVYVNVYWARNSHGAERLPDRLCFETNTDDGEQYFFEWCETPSPHKPYAEFVAKKRSFEKRVPP